MSTDALMTRVGVWALPAGADVSEDSSSSTSSPVRSYRATAVPPRCAFCGGAPFLRTWSGPAAAPPTPGGAFYCNELCRLG